MLKNVLCSIFVAMLAVPALALHSASALTTSPVLLEYSVDPGDTVVGTIKLRNEGESPETFYPLVRDFVAGEDGETPSFIEAGPGSSAPWVSFETPTVPIRAGEDEQVVFRINVPKDATPGGHYVGLLFSNQNPTVSQGVGVSGAVGPIVLLNVSGNIVEKGTIASFTATPSSATSLPIEFETRFKNAGNSHLKPRGVIVITNWLGSTVASINVNEDARNVLPNSTRQFSTAWQKTELPENASELVKEIRNRAFGPYKATLRMSYGESEQIVAAQTSFWVMPWMIIVVIVICFAIFLVLLMQYNKWIVSRAGLRSRK